MPENEKKVEETKVEETPIETKPKVEEEQPKEKVEEKEAPSDKVEIEEKPIVEETKKSQEVVPPETKIEGEIDPRDIKPEEPKDTRFDELTRENAELKKTLEGLSARIGSLEEALTKSGVMTNENAPKEQPIGATPNNLNANNNVDDLMSSILNEINKTRM